MDQRDGQPRGYVEENDPTPIVLNLHSDSQSCAHIFCASLQCSNNVNNRLTKEKLAAGLCALIGTMDEARGEADARLIGTNPICSEQGTRVEAPFKFLIPPWNSSQLVENRARTLRTIVVTKLVAARS
jgi:hypothetical protein